MKPIIIIGTGLAGYTLAREFRKLDQETPLTIITADQGDSYSKPMLSNALTRKQNPDQLPNASAEQMAKQLNATILTETTVTRIDAREKRLSLLSSRSTGLGFDTCLVTGSIKPSTKGAMDPAVKPRDDEERAPRDDEEGQALEYSKLVLATGAKPLPLKLEGNAVDSVFSINNLDDYRAFRQVLTKASHLTIIGSGLIGCEYANDLTNAGYRVSVCSNESWPLRRLLPEKPARVLQQALSDKQGVDWHFNNGVVSVEHKANRFLVTLRNGETIETDLVLSAIGIQPDLKLADSLGLETNDGVVVNAYLETSLQSVYALGDCAEVYGEVLPFILPIRQCATALAKTLSGDKTQVVYPCMPVTVKTPAHPVVVSRPGLADKPWQISGDASGMTGLYKDNNEQLRGFFLTGNQLKQRLELTQQIRVEE